MWNFSGQWLKGSRRGGAFVQTTETVFFRLGCNQFYFLLKGGIFVHVNCDQTAFFLFYDTVFGNDVKNPAELHFPVLCATIFRNTGNLPDKFTCLVICDSAEAESWGFA